MTMTPLFPVDQTATSRRTDPDTSHDAGESMNCQLPHDQSIALDAFIAAGDQGANAWQVQSHFHKLGIHREQGPISKRISELDHAGLIERTPKRRPGRTGRQQVVWVATDEGRAVRR